MKPNFIGLGLSKAGTTTVFKILSQHPSIFVHPLKELHFFDDDHTYSTTTYSSYFENFNISQEIVSECSPGYFHNKHCAERIYQEYGEKIKFLLLLRSPADRAFSTYWMIRRQQITDRPFEDLVSLELEKIKLGERDNLLLLNCFYDDFLKKYFKYFPKNNFLYSIFENDIAIPNPHFYSRVCNFLEIEDFEFDINLHENPASMSKYFLLRSVVNNQRITDILKKNLDRTLLRNTKRILNKIDRKKKALPKLSDEYRNHINSYFENSINALENMTELDLSIWKEY